MSELQKTKSAINKGIKSSYLKLICTSNSKKMKRKETMHLFILLRGTTEFCSAIRYYKPELIEKSKPPV